MWVLFVLGMLAHAFLARVVFNNDRRDTPLHIACRKGNVKTVKYLLDHGADPNVFNFFRETPLLLACGADSAVIVKMLLDKNADSNDAPGPGLPQSTMAAIEPSDAGA